VLTDAISSEAYRLWRNKTILFWAFLFVPLLAFGFDFLTEGFLKPAMAQGQPLPKPEWARLFLNKVGAAGGFLTVITILIGAASLFASDYRWETWRLMAPRNSRVNQILGKLVVLMGASLVTLVLVAVLSFAGNWAATLINHASAAGEPQPPIQLGFYWLVAFSLLFVTLLQVLVATGVVALFAVLTRSIVGSMLVSMAVYTFMIVALLTAQQVVTGPDPMHPDLWRLFAWPEFSAQLLMLHVGSKAVSGQQAVEAGLAREALLALVTWIVVGFGGAILLFRRQDLSKE
jgi:ABC-2 type transport system permease protein